ncbi:MAG: hypothetical protein AVDCRST_MAG77-3471 [uncultured Chloroflexi bacterium]|uniref:Uncharacterized protein n=1 Tax=uncultured Chloroflexota bacterium TaxID=166587 RepID=A0A6J4JFT9_9CHLR|nr:MAG: hypothetical protein AVDCRST_MAG77-3471 [uncultured Chloroflexota bacterium]
MEPLGSIVLVVIVVTVIVVLVPRVLGGATIVCTRCDGSGQIDERWPDPKEPTGFHTATGKCPKCKGKGRVRP